MRGTIVSAAHSLKPTMVNERTGHNGGVAEQMTAINPDLLHFSELVNGCMEMRKRRCSDSQWKKTKALRGEVDSRGVKGEEWMTAMASAQTGTEELPRVTSL